RLRARRRLEEQIDLRLARKSRVRFPLLPADRDHRLGAIKQLHDFVLLEIGYRNEVTLVERGEVADTSGGAGAFVLLRHVASLAICSGLAEGHGWGKPTHGI